MSNLQRLRSQVALFPLEPGCYIMRDAGQDIIYIGKAKSLRKRVFSYFRKTNQDPKTRLLMNHIAGIEYIVMDSEVEALVLEAELIRKHKPKYNIDLKDSVRYAYLLLTDEPYPRLLSVRDKTLKGRYFGPYTDAHARETVAEMAKRFFHIRTCGTILPKRVCLQYHIKRCDAPCVQNISFEEYQKNIRSAALFLLGKTDDLEKALLHEMKARSHALEYEKAKVLRDQIQSLKNLKTRQKVSLIRDFNQDIIASLDFGKTIIIQVFHIKKGVISNKKEFRFDQEEGIFEHFVQLFYSANEIPEEIIVAKKLRDHDTMVAYLQTLRIQRKASQKNLPIVTIPKLGVKKELLSMVEKNIRESAREQSAELVDLQTMLNLPCVPSVIECFDISNLSDIGIVGAMVQYRDNRFDKTNYRKFRIRSTATQDDFASMAEVVHRRYRRMLEEDKEMPDLIVIDGGKGQLHAAMHSLLDLGLKIPIIGLAKKFEEIYIAHESRPLNFEKSRAGMRLLINIRDEAHRFAIKYHRFLRDKMAFR
ncbi:MAG: excinuclease ABC subunit UvrC [Parcubacteria group bacterium]|nr:excinuclease ABC subunit UvrC [Parcubacteria group bacterium]